MEFLALYIIIAVLVFDVCWIDKLYTTENSIKSAIL